MTEKAFGCPQVDNLPPDWVIASYFEAFGRSILILPDAIEQTAKVAASPEQKLCLRIVNATALCQAGDYSEAAAAYQQLATELSSDVAGTDSEAADPTLNGAGTAAAATALAGHAGFLYLQGRYEAAQTTLQRAIGMDPAQPVWRCNLANVYFDSGDQLACEAQLAMALELDPNCAEAHLQRGHVELFAGRKVAAIPHIRTALAEDDTIPLAHLELGLALQARGDADQSIYVLTKAAEQFPDAVELHCFHAELLGATGDLDQGMARLRTLVQQNPACPLPFLHAGLLLASLSDRKGAMAHLQKASEVDTNFDAAHVEIAQLLLAEDDVAGAKVHFEKALAAARSLPELEIALAARATCNAQMHVAEILQLPISQVIERLMGAASEAIMIEQQGMN